MRSQKGFTLIEVLIVVAIIGIIAAIAIPGLLRAKASAYESAAIADARSVAAANNSYASVNGAYYVAQKNFGCLSTVAMCPGGGTGAAWVGNTGFLDSSIAPNADGTVAVVKSAYSHVYYSTCNALSLGCVGIHDPGADQYVYGADPMNSIAAGGGGGAHFIMMDASGMICESNTSYITGPPALSTLSQDPALCAPGFVFGK